MNRSKLWACCVALLLCANAVSPALAQTEEAQQEDALATAVALNYCRASFHRIRKNPNAEVLQEEQEKILNNLNLAQLDDPEIVALYSSLLDEISQIGISDHERKLYHDHHKSTIRKQITWDALAFGTDLMTAQFGSAVRTGANSWWDYRTKTFQRDVDLLKIDKTRMNSVVQRSSQFLDTFWKLAQKKTIPDRWLVRGDDLDALEVAMKESDVAVRLRILKRMEPFMEAYPPYWYYVARSKQENGEMTGAMETYAQLESLGAGHFRKDDMLATAMANQAAIQDFLGQTGALASARKSLNYSTDVWEANLISARVLQRRGQFEDAEDAILRNLDVKLEESQSTVFLASLYYFTKDDVKLAKMLSDETMVARLPAPVLLRCAAMIGIENTPPAAIRNVLASLEAYPRMTFGPDQLQLRVGHAWQLHLAKLEVLQNGSPLQPPQVAQGKGYYDLHYAGNLDYGSPVTGNHRPLDLTVQLTYPDETVVTLQLNEKNIQSRNQIPLGLAASQTFQISDIRIGDESLAIQQASATPGNERVKVQTAKPVFQPEQIPLPPVKEMKQSQL